MTYVIYSSHDTATTHIYTLSLHDALPISRPSRATRWSTASRPRPRRSRSRSSDSARSEEHTSELQSQFHLVCRLLVEKKESGDADLVLVIMESTYQLVRRRVARTFCVWCR